MTRYFIDGPSAAQDYEIRTDKAHSRGWGILVAVRATKSAAADFIAEQTRKDRGDFSNAVDRV